jgi:hypothetical protein
MPGGHAAVGSAAGHGPPSPCRHAATGASPGRRSACTPDRWSGRGTRRRRWCRQEVSQIGDTCRRCATRPDEDPPARRAGVDGGVARSCRRSATPVVDVQHDPTSTHRQCREGRRWCRREVSQIGDTCRRCATRPDEHPPPSTADGPEHGVHGGAAGADLEPSTSGELVRPTAPSTAPPSWTSSRTRRRPRLTR